MALLSLGSSQLRLKRGRPQSRRVGPPSCRGHDHGHGQAPRPGGVAACDADDPAGEDAASEDPGVGGAWFQSAAGRLSMDAVAST